MTTTNWVIFPRSTPWTGFTKMVHNEFRQAWRFPIGLIFGIGLPTLLLVIFGSLPAFHKHRANLGGGTYFNQYIPVLIALVVAALAFYSLPNALASYREQGILRRLSTTPAPPSWVLAAQLIVNTALAVIALLIVIVLGMTAYGVAAPVSWAGLILSCFLTILALFACALLIGAVAQSANAAGGLGSAFFFPLMFFAGLWVPRAEMPHTLQQISNYTPLGAAVEAVQRSLQTGFPTATPLWVLPAYAVVFGALAIRFFKWE